MFNVEYPKFHHQIKKGVKKLPNFTEPWEETEQCPQGLKMAVCYAMKDIGWQPIPKFNNTLKQIVFFWETSDKDKKGRRFTVNKMYTNSMDPRAHLRKDLKAWRGMDLTEDEIKGRFDLDLMIGMNCILNIVHNESGGKNYVNVQNVSQKDPNAQLLYPTRKPTDIPNWINSYLQKQVANPNQEYQQPPPETQNQQPNPDDNLPF